MLILKLHEGRPHVLDAIKNHQIQLIINTPSGEEAQTDAKLIRRSALTYKIPIITTIAGARATAAAIRALKSQSLTVKAIQDYTAGSTLGEARDKQQDNSPIASVSV